MVTTWLAIQNRKPAKCEKKPRSGSYIIPQEREPDNVGKMPNLKLGAGDVQNESGEYCVARKKGSTQINKMMGV